MKGIMSFFHILSGDDRSIIRQCSVGVQRRFAWIGFLVALVMLSGFVGVTLAFIHLFDSLVLDIAIGIFFALMLGNIYLLVLYTLSKNLLPHRKDKNAISISLLLRFSFIILFAVLVSKPIELHLLNPVIQDDLEAYRQELFLQNVSVIDSLYGQSLKELEELKSNGDQEMTSLYDETLRERKAAFSALKKRIDNSEFYIHQFRILSTNYPFTWILTAVMAALFMGPLYLKYVLSENYEYYQEKKKIEMRIVLEEYASFKQRYKKHWKQYYDEVKTLSIEPDSRLACILRELVAQNFEFAEAFVDPPFNTKRKKDLREKNKQSVLKAELYAND